ncbi:MAG TPA: Ig-like domain-containing protein [Longimicrobium sp.]|nr:Ig-like domain-containing protein [Longimicrobium sp.]
MSRIRSHFSLAVLVLAASACDGGGITQARAGSGGALLFAGPTASVTVTCPTPLEAGYGGQCVAYGYDASGIFTSSSASSWWSSNSSVVSVSSSGYITAAGIGTATIYATVDGITGSRTVQVTSPLTVSINGSSTAESGDYQCYFWATASGGTGTGYTYNWSVSGGGWGSASGDSWTGGGTSDFTLYVTVTDSGNTQAQSSFFVDVVPANSSLGVCFH